MLFLSHHAPWPSISGGRVRDAQLLPVLLGRATIDLVVVTPSQRLDREAVERHRRDGLTPYVFSDTSRANGVRHRESAAAVRKVRSLASSTEYAVVHVEGHYMLPFVPRSLLRRTVLVEHNIESALLQQRLELGYSDASPRLIEQLRRREELAWASCATVVMLTEEDRRGILDRNGRLRVNLIANGSDHIPLRRPSPRAAHDGGGSPRLLFLANFGYLPNADALVWLLDSIFPRIRERLAGATLALVGANLSASQIDQARRHPGVEVVGLVPSVIAELDRADVVLCPLRIGGGIKVKVLEALRRGRPLVSTSIGVQGLPSGLREGVAIADDAQQFSACVVDLCRQERRRRRQLERLTRAQDLLPTWGGAARQLQAVWQEVAESHDDGGRRRRADPVSEAGRVACQLTSAPRPGSSAPSAAASPARR